MNTEPIPFPWLLPSVPTRVVRRSVLRSPFMRHLRAAVAATFWPAAVCSGLILAAVALTYLQGIAPTTAIR